MKRSITVVLVSALALAGCGIFRGDDSKGPRTPTVGERLPVLTFEQKLEADPSLEGVSVVLPPVETNDNWTQPGGNAAKSAGHLSGPTNPVRAWEVSIGEGSSGRAELNAGPVIAGGKVFTIDTSATVRAFDAATGRTLWAHRVEGAKKDRNTAFGGGVAVGGDRVFATTGYGAAVALNAANGSQIWKVTLGGPLRGAPAVEGERVYVMSQDNQMFALNVATGETLWDATGTAEQAGLLSAGAPAIALDTVVVGFSSGELNALRVENGRVVWQDALARTGRTTALGALSDIDAPPVIDRGRVYAIGHGGRMAALELATGQRLWEQSL
ncbi:MAG: PQQ-binding-like beta-propeller repeat protein, partial [Alphaproteobacteria bacterium]|nr:PQQ-binding-like beta-propeller repeat protein [Alphaproteobacteria bacterium]